MWHRKAADRGIALAEYGLGLLYEVGEGVHQDYAEAAKWHREAADQGSSNAQAALGSLYSDGAGVPQDNVQAHMWFNLAAAQGDMPAARKPDQVATKMTPAETAEAQAFAFAWKPQVGQQPDCQPPVAVADWLRQDR